MARAVAPWLRQGPLLPVSLSHSFPLAETILRRVVDSYVRATE